MKICIVTTSFLRFPDDSFSIYIYRFALALVESGIEVIVVAPADHNTKDREIINDIKIERFRYFFPKKLQKLAYGKSGIPGNLKSSFLAWLQIPFFLTAFSFKILKVCKQCDIVHAHWLPSALVSFIPKILLGIPLVLTEHNVRLRHYPFGLIHLLNAADVITSAHPELKARIEKSINKNVVEIPNMLDTEKFIKAKDLDTIKKEFNIKNEKVVTLVCRLVSWKGPLTLLETIPLILKKRKDIKFLIVGSGELLEEMQKQIFVDGFEKNVLFTGPRKDISRILSISDLFLALSNIENIWSTTIIEAMLLEVPCIITKAGSTEKVLTHEKNCLLIKKENPEELANGIEYLLGRPDLRINIAKNSKYFITKEKGYEKKIILEKYLNIYKQLVS